jgi:hypothetical protein
MDTKYKPKNTQLFDKTRLSTTAKSKLRSRLMLFRTASFQLAHDS